MPIYEYRCTECGYQNEYLQKVSEPPMTVCPSCDKPTFTKLLSAAGFQLKGSGWYATDFKNSGTRAAKGKDTGEARAADKGGAKPDAEKAPADGKADSGKAPAAASASASTSD